MTIIWRSTNGNFADTLYNTLESLEAPTTTLRWKLHANVATPTIGIGFDLLKAGLNERMEVFRGLGFTNVDNVWPGKAVTPGSADAKEQQYIQSLLNLINNSSVNQAGYDAIMQQRANETNAAYVAAYPVRRNTFTFANDTEVREVFDKVWPTYANRILAYFPTLANDTAFKSSKEFIAIACSIYVGSFGPKAAAALNEGNRAKAWYELRYGWKESTAAINNPNNGWAKRHYFESAMLGLYNDPANATSTPEEAKQTYEVLTKNRTVIMQREFKYGVPPDGTSNSNNWIDKANIDYASVLAAAGSNNAQSLADSIAPAYNAFITYANSLHGAGGPDVDKSIISNAAAIYFQGDAVAAKKLDARVDDARSGNSLNNNLLVGGAGNDKLYGGTGSDYLLGNGGNDLLNGGTGNDTLIGGVGDDLYIYKTGDGNDRIVEARDADGKIRGRIRINGVEKDLFAAGLFIQQAGQQTWTAGNGSQITLTHNSPWTLHLADGSTIELGEDFQDGDYGINIEAALADPTTTRTIVGDLSPIDPNTPTYDDLGNVVADPAQPAPGRFDYLQDSTGNDDIRGLGGTDIIDAWRGGDDKLDGGTGDDIVSGRDGNDIVIGGEGMDLLRGDAGRDELYAGSEVALEAALTAPDAPASGLKGDFIDGGDGDDVLVGDAGNDALNGGDGADIIVGGAGDDNIKGDLTTSLVTMDWSVTRTTSVDANGTTVYSMDYNNVSFTSPTVGGADVIYAGAGVDWVNGQQGDDYLDGGSGDDVLFGDAGHDILLGGTGNDDLIGDNTNVAAADQGDDYLDGADGNDTLNGDGGSDVLFGGIGNDKLYGDSDEALVGNDYLDGEEGDDYLWGGGGDDDLRGGDGIDTLHGGTGDDYLDGGVGADTLAGMAGADVLFGGDGADFLQGDSGTGVDEGNDYLDGEAGDDTLLGEGGDDILVGGAGADVLQGDAGHDDLSGDDGMDTLSGGDGDDTLSGGANNDQLAGGTGNDYLDGGDGDNVIDAGDGDDAAFGGAGIDRIYGMAGNDYLDGMAGNDDLQGGDGADTVNGGAGDDLVFGQAGADVLSGGDGADQLVGGTENDTLNGDLGADILHGQAGADVLYGGDDADQLAGGTENDMLYGDAGDDVIWGDAGDDWLVGGFGNDALQGGDGNDVYLFGYGYGQDLVIESDAFGGSLDRVLFDGYVSADEVTATRVPGTYDLQLQIDGTADTLTISGHYYDGAYQMEEIHFSDGTVWTPATSLPSFVQGSASSDLLSGTSGADVFKSGAGSDVMNGGAGNDAYRYFLGDGADYIVDYDATAGNVDKIVFGSDILSSQVRTSRSGNDLQLTVNALDSITISNYFLDEGASPYAIEQVKFIGDGTVWTVDAVKQAALAGSDGNDVLTGYALNDQLAGFGGADTLLGGAGDDTLIGGAGDDSLSGGAGNDLYVFARGDGVNVVDDGDLTAGNTDTIQFAADILPADVKLRRTGFNSFEISVAGDTTVVNVPFQFGADGSSAGGIERIQFLADGSFWDGAMIASMVSAVTDGNDVLYGFDAQGDSLGGAGGNDALHGGGGNDTLNGGAGDDSLYGGAGSDSYVVGLNGGADVVAEIPGGLSADVDRLTFVDGINYADATFTRDGYDLLIGSATKGFDVRVVGQFGADSDANGVEQAVFADGTTLDRAAMGLKVGVGTAGSDVFDGSESNEAMDGLAGDDLIYGRGGDDTLNGGMGYDSLYGGAGSDTYLVGLNAGVDVVAENPGGLSTDVDRLVFVDGINFADAAFARDGNDLLISSGTKGFDVRVADQFGTDENANGVEQLVFADGTTLDKAALVTIWTTPTEGNNILYGDVSNDYINALGGDDVIYGGDGDDTLRGGAGSDTLYGGNGNDTYVVEYGDGYTLISDADSLDPAVGGVDTLIFGAGISATMVGYYHGNPDMTMADQYGNVIVTIAGYYSKGNFEKIILANGTVITQADVGQSHPISGTTSADTINGTNAADRIYSGDGNDLVYANAGNDTLSGSGGNDTIYGGAGADYIEGFDSDLAVDMFYGGAGNDRYTVSDQLDVIIEYAGEGVDTVWAFDISYTLGAEVENLTLVGTSVINGTGNNLDNLLVGNGAKNVLTAHGGNDTLDGGVGPDTMIGGAGDDTYFVDDSRDAITENLNEGLDAVQSSVSHTLASNVEVLTLTGTAAVTGTDNGLNNLLIGNGAVNTLTAGTGNDLLQAGAGNDIVKDTAGNNMLDAGAGDDSLTGSSGKELFIGGAGNDTITTGSGADIIAFNRGDGQDIVVASTGTDNTIALGGGIQYASLAMRKSGSDLILDTGNSEQLTLQNWYKGTTNHSVLNLQLVLDATSYDPASPDSLVNHRVQTFNFTTLTNGFDQALAANPNLTSWSLTNALLTAHLSGSDSAALGGDLAYQYNLNNSLSGIGLAPAQTVVSDANFGTAAQTLRPLSELQTGSVRLS